MLPQFQNLCGAYETLQRNLSQTLDNLGLTAERKQSAERYLSTKGISTDFPRDVVQATARASDEPADDDFLQPMMGGNYQLIDRLLKPSGAQLYLNRRVTVISRSNRGKYHFTVRAEGLLDRSSNFEAEEYDAIIIATPLQGAELNLDLDVHVTNALTPQVERYVTHFTTAKFDTLSPYFFNVSNAGEIPEKIFSTIGTASDPHFLSIESSIAYLELNGCVAEGENLYRMVSAAPVEDGMIAKLLGRPQNSTLTDLEFRWIHRQIWPLASPKVSNHALLDNVEIAKDLFYTGVGEEVVSSSEMSCRMGKLVAGLLYYSIRPPSPEAW